MAGETAADRARRYLHEVVQACARSGKTRLPTIGTMAREGGFSPRTISTAVDGLKQEGVLTAVQRGGIHINKEPGTMSEPEPVDDYRMPTGRRRWQRVRERIAADIVNGTFSSGVMLPSLKELCLTYGAAFQTVKRALQALVADGKVEEYGRGYRVFEPRARTGHACLVLIAHSAAVGDLGTVIPRNPEFLRELERECMRSGIRLCICTEGDVHLSPRARCRGVQASDAVVGYMVWIRGIPAARIEELLGSLASAGAPVAILDEDGNIPLARMVTRRPRMRVFTVANSRAAGIDVGNHLLRTGHRRVAYLTPVDSTRYSRNRHEGIAHAFAETGLNDAVDHRGLGRYQAFEDVQRSLDRTPACMLLREHIRTFEADVQGRDTWTEDKFYTFYTDTYLLRRALQKEMTPLFDTLLEANQATAWVGVNDWIALAAMAHVRDRGVRVPDSIAMVGFDDTFEAFSHDLTSYNFNMPALARAMLNHILAPPSARRREPLPALEIPGVVMARQSTAGGPNV